MPEHFNIATVAFDEAGQQRVVSASKPLPVTFDGEIGGGGGGGSAPIADTLTPGAKTVTVPSTPEAIVSSPTPCLWAWVQAPLSNKGSVFVAGIELYPGDERTIRVANAQAIMLDAEIAGEGVAFVIGSVAA